MVVQELYLNVAVKVCLKVMAVVPVNMMYAYPWTAVS